MKTINTDIGYNIEGDSETLVVESLGLGGKASTNYQGDELMVKVKLSLMHFLTPQFVISKNGQAIGKITRKYFGGDFKIHFKKDGQSCNFLLKIAAKKFDLEDADKRSVLTIKKNYSWSDFENNYDIQTSSLAHETPNLLELTFYAVFCVNYYCSTGGGTIAG